MVTNTPIEQDSILVSIDISSLYTNIPHMDGVQAAIQALKSDTDPDRL